MRYLILLAILFGTYSSVILRKITDPDSLVILASLKKLSSLPLYLQALWNYQTVDFQPVRDLSLYLDLFLSSHLGLETFVFQNLLWWMGALYFLEKILKNLFREIPEKTLFFILLLFAIYPLFSPVLLWGMARKHILALFFGLVFVDRGIDERRVRNVKNSVGDAGIYALAVLSQPISILLPFWAIAYRFKNLLRSLPSLVIFVILARFNYYYYETSSVFRFYYPAKTGDAFNYIDKLLGLGHYFFRLFFPYQTSFYYSLGNPTVFIGIGILIASTYTAFKLVPRRPFLLWMLFILMPLGIVLTMPPMLSDTYLLFPSVGVLILLIYALKKYSLYKFGYLLLIFWVIVDIGESRNWITAFNLSKSGFERQPNCLTAFSYIKVGYENGLKANPQAKKYLEHFDCPIGDSSTAQNSITTIIFNSNVLFYEEDVPVQGRLDALDKMSHVHYYAHLMKAALLIKEKRFQEADQTLLEFETRWPKVKTMEQYVPSIALYVDPYCQEKGFLVCSRLTKTLNHATP
jgi:hypothetical protein